MVFSYGYDRVNNLTSVVDSINGQAGATEAFSYDALNRVTSITQSGPTVSDTRVDFSYDAASQMTGTTRFSDLAGNNTVANSTYSFDASGRLTDLEHLKDGNPLAFYRFTYDDDNRLTRFESVDGSSDFSYNERDELTATDHSYQTDEAYSYDNQGNRINDGYVTGLENRLLEDGTYVYTYDNEGNRLTRTEIATGIVDGYSWDHHNRLTAISTMDSGGNVIRTAEYTYDIYGRRILKVVDSDGAGANPAETEAYIYDGEHIALVFDGNGNQVNRYLHGPQVDQVLAEETANGEVRWTLTDNQGSVHDIVNNDGTVLNHVTYDSFGQITSQSDESVTLRFAYTGREYDAESGQYFYRARYYDPTVGRFINEDPIGFEGGDTNLFRYVGNSPLNYIDSSGLCRIELRYRPRLFGDTYADFHADIVITENTSSTVFWAGPQYPIFSSGNIGNILGGIFFGSGGNIISNNAEFTSQTFDFYETINPNNTTLIYDSGDECICPEELIDSIQETFQDIEKQNIPYNIFGPNSNTAVRQALLNASLISPLYHPSNDVIEWKPIRGGRGAFNGSGKIPTLPGWYAIPDNPQSKGTRPKNK